MTTGVKIAVGVVLVLAVLIGGCFAFTGGEDDETQAITLEQFDSVQVGATRQQVEDELGRAASAEELARIGIKLPRQGPSTCIYYPEEGEALGKGRMFQFCFTDDKLGFKRANRLP